MAALSGLGKLKNTGLLITRLGLGAMFVLVHGYPKLIGGTDRWEAVGGAMANFGLDFGFMFWGLAAAIVETLGGIFFVLGLWFRPAALALTFVMLVAALSHWANGTGLFGAAHPIEVGVACLGLAFLGPGKYSVDKR